MRYQFSIRDLFWLTALVAVLFAWWLDHRRLAAQPDRVDFWKQTTTRWALLPPPVAELRGQS
jgi:hypothetical protein